MATEKVGVYRKYHGPNPKDKSGQPCLKSEWPKKRAFRWAVRWFGAGGKRYSRSFKTRKEAERFAETKQSSVRNGRADPPPAIRLKNFKAEHEQVMRGQVARRTLDDQKRALRMFMEHMGENIQLQKISPRHAESFIAARLASGVAVGTVNKDIRTLKRIFNLAIEPRGYMLVGTNPFERIKPRRKAEKPIRYVSLKEYRALMNGAKNDIWWRALISLAYGSGLRRGEILNLTWADIDFERQQIHVIPKEETATTLEWEPKDHENRELPVPEEAMQLLANLQATTAEGVPYVFVPAWRWHRIQQMRREGQWKKG
jgi:integrase